jgi:small-conductance mechanosensitive channel
MMTGIKTVVMDNDLRQWLIALLIIAGTLLLVYLFRRIVVWRLKAYAKKTEMDVDDFIAEFIGRTRFIFILVVAVYCSSLALDLPDTVRHVLQVVLIVVCLFQVAWWGMGLINYLINRRIKQEPAEDVTTWSAVRLVAQVILWCVVILLALENVTGVRIDTLLASLGIGGIAVALAVQNILADLFASLSIALDRPFVIGDAIMVGDFTGSVEHIGLKSTRLRSVSGEQLIFSNQDLLASRIRNFKRMERRRVDFITGVTYHTPSEKLAAIPAMVQEIVEGHEKTTFERCHLKELGSYAINFETVFYVEVPDFQLYMDIQQDINLILYQRFEQAGIGFAYPTQTIVMDG